MNQNLFNFLKAITDNPSLCLILSSGVLIGKYETHDKKSRIIFLSMCEFNGKPLNKHKMEIPMESVIAWGKS